MSTLASLLTEFPLVEYLDAQLLATHTLQTTREHLLAHPEITLTETQTDTLRQLLTRRAKHEPLAYILGHREFYGLDFIVTPDTLIPRPETELLVEEAVKLQETMNNEQKARHIDIPQKNLIIDVGTGSGNIIITLATLLREKNILDTYDLFALDISDAALIVAEKNAACHTISHAIHFLRSDLLESLIHQWNQTTLPPYNHIMILANLPYLSHEIYASADADVRDFEPITALVSDEHGLKHYQRLLQQWQIFKSPQNTLPPTTFFFEISPEQEAALPRSIREYFPQASISTITDFTHRPRIIKCSL